MTDVFYYYPNVVALMRGRNSMAALAAALEEILTKANGRTIVLPELKGGFLPHFVREAGVETLPWGDFTSAQAGAIASAKARREAHFARCVAGPLTKEQVVDLSVLAARRVAKAHRAANLQKRAEENRWRKGASGKEKKAA